MAKKEKSKQDKSAGAAADAAEAIRNVIERTLEGAGLTEKRQRELTDQVTAAAGRIKQTLDDLHVVDEVRDLRKQLETLAARVAELESGARSRVTDAAKAATGRGASSTTAASGTRSTTAASSTRSTAAKKPAAKKPAAKKSAASTASKSTGTRSRASSTRSTAAKPTGTRAKPSDSSS